MSPEPDREPHRKTMRRADNPGDARLLTFSCYRRMHGCHADGFASACSAAEPASTV